MVFPRVRRSGQFADSESDLKRGRGAAILDAITPAMPAMMPQPAGRKISESADDFKFGGSMARDALAIILEWRRIMNHCRSSAALTRTGSLRLGCGIIHCTGRGYDNSSAVFDSDATAM